LSLQFAITFDIEKSLNSLESCILIFFFLCAVLNPFALLLVKTRKSHSLQISPLRGGQNVRSVTWSALEVFKFTETEACPSIVRQRQRVEEINQGEFRVNITAFSNRDFFNQESFVKLGASTKAPFPELGNIRCFGESSWAEDPWRGRCRHGVILRSTKGLFKELRIHWAGGEK
jgi:hypothetical protein